MRADFYLLDSQGRLDLYSYIVKLSQKALAQSFKVCIHIPSEEDARALSDCFWTLEPDSFIPHRLLPMEEAQEVDAAITIDSKAQPHFSEPNTLLVLASPDLPENWLEAERLCVICANDPAQLSRARASYKSLAASSIDANIHDFRAQT